MPASLCAADSLSQAVQTVEKVVSACDACVCVIEHAYDKRFEYWAFQAQE